jgi:hypothetical protein
MPFTASKLACAVAGLVLALSPLASATEEKGAALHPGTGNPTEIIRSLMNDPKIRDFVTPSENAWDFTKPDSVPGFGSQAQR